MHAFIKKRAFRRGETPNMRGANLSTQILGRFALAKRKNPFCAFFVFAFRLGEMLKNARSQFVHVAFLRLALAKRTLFIAMLKVT